MDNTTYIKRCIELAKNGLGTTYPNPLVGSLIVHNDKIIGEGWHKKSGEPHAEINAINHVKNKELLSKSTIYVSLEPCSFIGKTPACAKTITEIGIPKVVIACTDPNEKVSGKGIQILRESKIDIIQGILEKEAIELNKRFFTYHNKKRPYIFLKWAQTLNGYLDNGDPTRKSPFWITNQYSRQWVHKRRTQEQAILVGTKTVLKDNPTLTARDWYGNNPIRLIIDKNLKIPIHYNIYNQQAKTLLFYDKNTDNKNNYPTNVELIPIEFKEDVIDQILNQLYIKGIQSVIVEGGNHTIQQFIHKNIWDEAEIFISQQKVITGTPAPTIQAELIDTQYFITDTLNLYKNTSQPNY